MIDTMGNVFMGFVLGFFVCTSFYKKENSTTKRQQLLLQIKTKNEYCNDYLK